MKTKILLLMLIVAGFTALGISNVSNAAAGAAGSSSSGISAGASVTSNGANSAQPGSSEPNGTAAGSSQNSHVAHTARPAHVAPTRMAPTGTVNRLQNPNTVQNGLNDANNPGVVIVPNAGNSYDAHPHHHHRNGTKTTTAPNGTINNGNSVPTAPPTQNMPPQ